MSKMASTPKPVREKIKKTSSQLREMHKPKGNGGKGISTAHKIARVGLAKKEGESKQTIKRLKQNF